MAKNKAVQKRTAVNKTVTITHATQKGHIRVFESLYNYYVIGHDVDGTLVLEDVACKEHLEPGDKVSLKVQTKVPKRDKAGRTPIDWYGGAIAEKVSK